MKELKMFPQITEETEENLLNLENDTKVPYSTTPPSSTTDSPQDAPSSPNCDNQAPCPLVTVTTEDAEQRTDIPVTNTSFEEECSTPPARVRMRSLSGGAYRLTPTLPSTGRMRRQSGDDVLTRVSPSRRAALFEHFRPRSKSDSKGKRPTFLTSLKNSIFSHSPQRKTSLEADPPALEPLQPGEDYRMRSRSGSETRGGTMSKMIDLFRSRSHSLSIDSKSKKPLNSIVPPNALLRRHSVDPDKRRRPFSTYRSLEAHQVEGYGHTEDDTVDRIDYANIADDRIIPTFLSSRTCYDVMPTSGKVVVLSVELLVKNAFEALVNNELRAAPLWDVSVHSFVGMLTISDFINVLRFYYRNKPENIKDIESQSIFTWRGMNKTTTQKSVKITGMNNLAMATKLLIEEGVHRLPVLDEARQCVLFVLTRKRLLHYIYYNIIEKFGKSIPKTPSFLTKSIKELEIGTFGDIATVTYKTKVIETLDLFMERKVSALPIVDEDNVVLDIFAKFDVFALAKEQTYHNLDMTIIEAIDKGKNPSKVHEDVYGCSLDDALGTVINIIVTTKAHRLVVIDEKKTPIGIVSISDILKFLVVQPLIKMEETSVQAAADIIEEGPEGAVGGSESENNVFLEAKEKFEEEPSGYSSLKASESSKPDAEESETEASDKDPGTSDPVE